MHYTYSQFAPTPPFRLHLRYQQSAPQPTEYAPPLVWAGMQNHMTPSPPKRQMRLIQRWRLTPQLTISPSTTVDGNYRVITLLFKNMVIYPSVWRIMHYSRYPRFKYIYIYTYKLSYIIYLGEPLGNIISNCHGTFIHIFMHAYYPIFLNIY